MLRGYYTHYPHPYSFTPTEVEGGGSFQQNSPLPIPSCVLTYTWSSRRGWGWCGAGGRQYPAVLPRHPGRSQQIQEVHQTIEG